MPRGSEERTNARREEIILALLQRPARWREEGLF